MRIIICGGHLTPAAAVIQELKDLRTKGLKNNKIEILFVGRKYPLEGDSTVSAEYKIITQMGIPFVSLTTGRLQRRFTRYTIPSLLKIPLGFFQALWWVGKFRPDIILSFGGYVALPVVVAGWLLRVPIVTHEQTVVSGLANKIIGFFAKKICVSWPDSVTHFPTDRVVLTGNPIRKEIFAKVQSEKFPPEAGLAKGGKVQNELPVVYITGGSLGSHAINEAVAECLPRLLEKYVVIHQCGDSEKYGDWEKLKASASAKVSADKQKRYYLTKYVGSDDIGWVLNKADLVVSRAGANTVTELAALGKPAIFIPLPWAGEGEQEKNAQMMEKLGAAVILPQEKLTGEELERQVGKMIENLGDYKKRIQGAKKLVDLTSTAKIVEVIDEVYAQRRKT